MDESGRRSLRSKAWQGSSVVEQGTHKPLVGGSNPPPATKLRIEAHVAEGRLSATFVRLHDQRTRRPKRSGGVVLNPARSRGSWPLMTGGLPVPRQSPGSPHPGRRVLRAVTSAIGELAATATCVRPPPPQMQAAPRSELRGASLRTPRIVVYGLSGCHGMSLATSIVGPLGKTQNAENTTGKRTPPAAPGVFSCRVNANPRLVPSRHRRHRPRHHHHRRRHRGHRGHRGHRRHPVGIPAPPWLGRRCRTHPGRSPPARRRWP